VIRIRPGRSWRLNPAYQRDLRELARGPLRRFTGEDVLAPDGPRAPEGRPYRSWWFSNPNGERVHGFVVTHPGGAVLVDTGVGGPDEMLSDWRVVNRSVADALAELDMTPGDIGQVINTHLHFDHCGQNAVFRHAPFYVEGAEVSRAQREAQKKKAEKP